MENQFRIETNFWYPRQSTQQERYHSFFRSWKLDLPRFAKIGFSSSGSRNQQSYYRLLPKLFEGKNRYSSFFPLRKSYPNFPSTKPIDLRRIGNLIWCVGHGGLFPRNQDPVHPNRFCTALTRFTVVGCRHGRSTWLWILVPQASKQPLNLFFFPIPPNSRSCAEKWPEVCDAEKYGSLPFRLEIFYVFSNSSLIKGNDQDEFGSRSSTGFIG